MHMCRAMECPSIYRICLSDHCLLVVLIGVIFIFECNAMCSATMREGAMETVSQSAGLWLRWCILRRHAIRSGHSCAVGMWGGEGSTGSDVDSHHLERQNDATTVSTSVGTVHDRIKVAHAFLSNEYSKRCYNCAMFMYTV
jgi:hypothetical protein